MNYNDFLKLQYLLGQLGTGEHMTIPQRILSIKILIDCMKRLGMPIDEVKKSIQNEDFSTEDDRALMILVDNIYSSSLGPEQVNNIQAIIMPMLWIPTLDLIGSVFRALMLSNRRWYSEQQIAYIGYDGKDYLGEEELIDANDNYKSLLLREISKPISQ